MKNNKKRRIITMMLIIMLMALSIGITYSLYHYNFIGNKNALETADISLEFLESNTNIITIENALPMSDNDGKAGDTTFDFSVTSKTNKEVFIRYILSIEKLSVDTNYTSLNDNQIKIYLTDYNNNEKTMPTLISNLSNYQLYIGTQGHDINHQTVQDKFKLRAWIDSSVDASNWNSSTKLQYKFKIGLTSEEKDSFSVYRHSTKGVDVGDPLEISTIQKYCIKGPDYYDSCDDSEPFDNITSCQNELNNKFGTSSSYTCKQHQITRGIGNYTEDYTTLNENYFLKHNISTSKTVKSSEVCYILNSNLYCLKGGPEASYSENLSTLYESFGQSNCSVISDYISCSASGIQTNVYQSGFVSASSGSDYCRVDNDNGSFCSDE